MSNFWQALALGGSPIAGGIPFITTALDTTVDALNFYFEPTNDRLFLGTNGDYSGLARFNFYGRAESYQPQSAQGVLGSAATSGFIVESSRGTGIVPALSQTGDVLGKFAAMGFVGVIPAYVELASINTYAIGATAANLGGELRFATKADNGVITEWLRISNTGAIIPMADGVVDLGAANIGIRRFYAASVISVAVGAQTINAMAGRFVIAAAGTSVVITNNQVNANSMIFAMPAQVDASGRVNSIVAGAGSFTVNCTGPAANMAINFLVINRDV